MWQGGKGARGPAPTNGAAASRAGAALEAWRRLAAPVARLLSPALRRTSLLLLLIWFTNALNYYGLVLLTTTVRPVNPYTLTLIHCPGGAGGAAAVANAAAHCCCC